MNLHEEISRIKGMMGLLSENKIKYGTILIFGPQGVGKSTITELLGRKINMEVISSDDFVDQGEWAIEPTLKKGWVKRKENEFIGVKDYLKNYLGKSVILDIGGSHGVWEGEQLEEIRKMIQPFKNTFLILPEQSVDKSIEFLRKRLVHRETGILDAIKYWEAVLSQDVNFAKNFNDEDKKNFMSEIEKIKKGNKSHAEYQIKRMKERYNVIQSGNIDWKEFDYNDEESENVKFSPTEFIDYSRYFMENMKKSGLSNHIIYNTGKENTKIVDEIIHKLI